MSLSLAGRLAAILLVIAALMPVQMLALRCGWRLAERLPVHFHRLLLALLRVRVTTTGRPPAPGAATLILANHVSWLDIPVLASLAPLTFVAKSEVETWPLVGALARLQRCIFVERRRRASTADVNAAVAARLGAGEAVTIFAEGTTGDGVRLLPFRSSLVGAAAAALDGAARTIGLVPVAIAYRRRRGLPLTRRDMPEVAWYGDMELAPHLGALIRGGPIDVTVVWGAPMPFDRASDRKRATLAAQAEVRAALAALRIGARPTEGPSSRPTFSAPRESTE